MNSRLILISLLFLAVVGAHSQSLFGNQKPTKKVYNNQRTQATPKTREDSKDKNNKPIVIAEKKDTALYLSLSKRFGWYYGIGRQLTREEAQHLPCYYRLTDPDSLGHFTHIEAVNGKGLKTTRHSMSTYLIENDDKSDKGADELWKEMLQTVVQWEIIPSRNGKHSAMEYGLDAEGNLIYTYIMATLNDSTVVGHYTDAFGEPISLRSGYRVAKYVQVIIDSLGYERKIYYLDDNAYFQQNTDEAYVQRKDYDTNGNLIRLLSCMINGHPTKDKWGNCGWIATYNDFGQILQKHYVDDELKPMKMPLKHPSAIDVMSRHFTYDSLRLIREEYFTTDKKVKDATKEGVHRKEWQYDQWGNILSVTSKDMNGNLCNDRDSFAQSFYRYNDLCQEILKYYKDKAGNFVNDASGKCLYSGEDCYMTTTGKDTIPVYKVIRSGSEIKTIDYLKDQIHIIQNDHQGRQIESSYYNLRMQPIEVDSCFRQQTIYQKKGTKQIQEDIRYAFKDTIRTLTITDYKEHTRIVQKYHGKTLLSCFGQTLDKDMEVSGQYGYDALGNRARSHLEDAQYYRVKSGVTYRGNTSYLMGRNEYDEPSYVLESEASNSNIYCTKLLDVNNKSILLDEDNVPITNKQKLRDSLQKVYLVEVLTTRAYKLGLRSGDIIVKYGSFFYPNTSNEKWKYRNMLQIETYMCRSEKKEVLLLRYDASQNRHKMVKLILPAGTEGELGFLIQTALCTKKEADRYNADVQSWLSSNHINKDDLIIDKKRYGTHMTSLIRPYKISTAGMSSWQAGLREDAIVIAVVNQLIDGKYYYVGIGDGENELWKHFISECDSTIIFYTTDGKHLSQTTLPGTGSARAASFSNLPTKEFNVLIELEKSIPQAFRDSISQIHKLLSPNQAQRYIRRHCESEKGFRYEINDYDFTRALNILSRRDETNIDLRDCGIVSMIGVWGDSKTTSEDHQLMKTVFSRIDYSGYEQTEANGYIIYFKRNPDEPSRLEEFVINGNSFLFVFSGDISLSLDTIKQGSYDKIH